MAWYDTDWTLRKKLTIPATSVAGTGTLTDFPLHVDLTADADILAGAHPTGKDLVFTASDGITKLAHELVPEGQWIGEHSSHTWFQEPRAWYDSTSGKTWFGTLIGGLQYIVEYNHSTEAYTQNSVGTSASADDHNNPTIIKIAGGTLAGKLLTAYTEHNGDFIRWRVSASNADATSFGSETTEDPNGDGATAGYTYPSLVELTDEGLIYLFYRHGNDTWFYITTSTDAISWSAPQQLFAISTKRPYLKAIQNGTGRIDFCANNGNPADDTGDMDVYHWYYDAAQTPPWRQTDGTSMGAIPALGFTNTDPTIAYDVGASDNAWINDIAIDASGHPRISFTLYPSAVDSDQDLYITEWSGSAWAGVKLADSGTGPSAGDPQYPGNSCFMPGDPDKLYAGIQVSSVYEIQLFAKTAGTWAKSEDITSGSSDGQFRPAAVRNSDATKRGHVIWVSGSYPSFTAFKTGVRAYPALGSYYKHAYVKIPSLDGANDNDIYVYYGNPAATPQHDPANVWSSNYISVLRKAKWLDKASPRTLYDRKGVATFTAEATDIVGTLLLPAADKAGPWGDPWQTSSNAKKIRVSGINLASLGAVTFQAAAWVDHSAGGTNEKQLVSSNVANSAADIFYRIEPTSGAKDIEALVILEPNAPTNSTGALNAGLTPVDKTWEWHNLVYDNSAGTLKARLGKSEGTIRSGLSATMDATATNTVYFGTTPAGADELTGYIADMRFLNVALSKDWTDTEYDAVETGIATFGTEEVPSAEATSYTLTGPSTGYVGEESSDFTVTPDGPATGDIVVTPSDGGAGGTFTPSTVTFADGTSTAQTFTYTPASAGAKTILTTNSSTLTDPADLTYTVSALASAYTLSGPSSGTVGEASTDFTVQATGHLSSAVVVTPSDGGDGGTFTPTSVTLAAGDNDTATFTYTPASTGAKTISTSDDGGLTDPDALTYTASEEPVAAADAYTLTGPASGRVDSPSGLFSVASNGSLASAVTITPSDGADGGSFSPATVELAAGDFTSATFRYTAASTGTKTISVTDSSTLTDPTSLSFEAVEGGGAAVTTLNRRRRWN